MRRGSIYVITLSSSLIVAVLATTALTTVRIQRLASSDCSDMRQAMAYAEAGLELARSQAGSDSTWRTNLAANDYSSDRAIGDGFYSYVGLDPLDNDLTNSPYHPIVITATGKKGTSVQKLSARFEVSQPGLSCIGSGVHAQAELTVQNATLTSLMAPVSSNLRIQGSTNGRIISHCESATTLTLQSGATVTGTISQNVPTKPMPDATALFNAYVASATTIPITSLPLWNRNYLSNPGGEEGIVGWTAQNCSVVASTAKIRSGTYSLYVSNRNILPLTFPSFIFQDVTNQIAQNVAYTLESWVYVPGAVNADSFRIRLQVNATGGNVSYTTPWNALPADAWTRVTGSGSVSWSGTLQSAYWYVETMTLAAPYYLDDCSMMETAAEMNTYVLHRTLLSPESNPITNVTNGQGIYAIDCQAAKINIRDCRVLGTLVLRNASNVSRIEGSLNCQPAVAKSVDPSTPNLLAIVLETPIKIQLSSAALDERLINRNLNPTGSPFETVTDTDLGDAYPSEISGIVYSTNEIEFSGTTTIHGGVLSNYKVLVRGSDPNTTSLTIHHNSLYRYVNPPIPLRAAPIVSLKSGSAWRAVD